MAAEGGLYVRSGVIGDRDGFEASLLIELGVPVIGFVGECKLFDIGRGRLWCTAS